MSVTVKDNTSERRAYCGSCGRLLSDPPNLPQADRQACPGCGSLSRSSEAICYETIKLSGSYEELHERQDKAIGYSESERKGRSTNATLQPDDKLDFSIKGISPRGEENTISVCEILKQRLNQAGANYTTVSPGNGPVDCILASTNNPNECLEIQVVNAITNQDLWKQLNLTGSSTRSLTLEEICTELHNSIMLKANHIPQSIRKSLILALDATLLPGLCFDKIIHFFQEKEGVWAGFGFLSIWLVGPNPRLTGRLDSIHSI